MIIQLQKQNNFKNTKQNIVEKKYTNITDVMYASSV